MAKGTKRIDQSVVDAYAADPDLPFLVSFPRTGSHWLRMLMELYFERPTLVRTFYYPERNDYLLLHTHDLSLDTERRRVIYLYRDPVDTIFSQLVYEGAPADDAEEIERWAERYGQHLYRWLLAERCTEKKAVVCYEGMKRDLAAEIRKLALFFERPFDSAKLEAAGARVTREEVWAKTRHDPKVVATDPSYRQDREQFRERQGPRVLGTVLRGRADLAKVLGTRTGV